MIKNIPYDERRFRYKLKFLLRPFPRKMKPVIISEDCVNWVYCGKCYAPLVNCSDIKCHYCGAVSNE